VPRLAANRPTWRWRDSAGASCRPLRGRKYQEYPL
jgi:hypothetical protein